MISAPSEASALSIVAVVVAVAVVVVVAVAVAELAALPQSIDVTATTRRHAFD